MNIVQRLRASGFAVVTARECLYVAPLWQEIADTPAIMRWATETVASNKACIRAALFQERTRGAALAASILDAPQLEGL